MLLTAIAFIIILGILILAHEFGHFIVARWAGVKVEEFGIGYPPRLFKIKRGETIYSLNVIPLGGFTRLCGEEGEDQSFFRKLLDRNRSFAAKPPRVRIAIVVAGVVMNFILAWLLFSVGFGFGMTPPVSRGTDFPGANVKTEILVADTQKGSPAEVAGIKGGDIIIGVPSQTFSSIEEMQQYTRSHLGQKIDIAIERAGARQVVSAQLSQDKDAPLGVSIAERSTVKVPFWRAPWDGLRETAKTTKLAVIMLGSFVKQLFISGQIPQDVAGPVGIFVVTGLVVQLGFIYLIQFVALLSISLAIINIAPFPPLDGGRLLFITLEGIFRKKVIAAKIENIINTVGFLLLIILILAVTYQEIFVRGIWKIK